MTRFLILVVLTIGLDACGNSDREFIGKWTMTRTVTNGKDDIQTKMNYESEFLPNGRIVNYYNGEADNIEWITYKIKNDSLYVTTISTLLHGVDTSNKKLYFTLNDNKLILYSTQDSYSEYRRNSANNKN